MGAVEIDSFVAKFKSLLGAGHNATLSFESQLGEVSITLNCKVGRITPPPWISSRPYVRNNKHRSPSYLRRQERQKADRVSTSVVLDTSYAEEADVSQQATEVSEVEANSCEMKVCSAVTADASASVNEMQPAEEVDQTDKMIDEVLVYTVGEPVVKKEVVENEIRECLSTVGVTVVKMQTFCNSKGDFYQSRVKTSPVRLKTICGRNLGLKNCEVIEFKSPSSNNV